MNEAVLRLLVLLRFLIFIALVYLSLHALFARLIAKSDSKVLGFFALLTDPLLKPVRPWLAPNAPESRLRLAALAAYGALWILVFAASEIAAGALR